MKNKIMFIIATLFSVLLLVPHKVSAETVYPEVTNDTKPDTLVSEDTSSIKVEGSKTDTITVTVSAGEFRLLAGGVTQEGATGENNRPENYAWIGLHFKFDTNASAIAIGPKDDFDSKKTTFNDKEFTEYFGFDVAALTEAAKNKEDFKKVAIAKWQVDGKEQQLTINIIIEPENITVYEKDSDDKTVAWDVENWLEESKQVAIDYYLLEGEDNVGAFTTYWDKETPLTMEDIEKIVNEFDEKYSVVGIYTAEDKKEEFELGKIAGNHTAIYVELSVKEPAESVPSTGENTGTEENPETGDHVITYITLGAMNLILSLGTVLYLKRKNS